MSAWVPVSLSTSALATLIEIETEEDGRLPLTSITPIFPGTTALKFWTLGNQAFSGEVPVEEGNFLAPEGGWGVSTRYIAVSPTSDIKAEPTKSEGQKNAVQSNSLEKEQPGKLRTQAIEKEKELVRYSDANPVGILEVVEEEHQDPNPPKSACIPDPDAPDNDIQVIDVSDSEEVEGPEHVESRKNATLEQITNKCAQQSHINKS